MALTEDAKKELKEAIRIVREDQFEQFVRGRLSQPEPEPKKDGPEPPPVKDDPETKNDPPEPEKRKSSYWGEIMDD